MTWPTSFSSMIFAWICLYAPASAELSAQTRQDHILFTKGGSQLDEDALSQIEALGSILNTPPLDRACFRLEGYSDASGGADINLSISQARAEAVAGALAKVLDTPDRILETEGKGAVNFLTEVSQTDPQQRRVAIMARQCAS